MSIKITATASGSLTPRQQPAPSDVTNIDFQISAQTGITGDGETEFTGWTFNFAGDPNFPFFSPSRPLTSALLTLTLTPKSPHGLIVTDAVGIQVPGVLQLIGGGSYGSSQNLSELKGLALDKIYTIHLQLLNHPKYNVYPYTSAAILGVLFSTGGQIPMGYNNDAIISSAKLELIQESPAFQYAAKFVCGKSPGVVVAPGVYFTAVNVHNPTYTRIRFRLKIAVALPGLKPGPVSKFYDAELGPDEALEIDCPDIFKMAPTDAGFLKGFVVIESEVELDVVVVYTASGREGQVETLHTERVSPRSRKAGAGEICVDFEPPLSVGTQYGAPAGHQSGNVVFSTHGIPVSVHDFNFAGGGGTFNVAHIDVAPVPFGSGQSMRTNNINLEFDFSNIGFAPNEVKFEFLDLGGSENISVNGSPIFAGELSSVPSPIGGVNVSVSTTPVTGGKKGIVILTGAVQRIRVGGQEFWIDNVCARQ
jgi:hypothetical protein